MMPNDPMLMMKQYVRKFTFLAVTPIFVGGILFLLGFILEPAVLRVLWLIISGFVVLAGIFGVLVIKIMVKKIQKATNFSSVQRHEVKEVKEVIEEASNDPLS